MIQKLKLVSKEAANQAVRLTFVDTKGRLGECSTCPDNAARFTIGQFYEVQIIS